MTTISNNPNKLEPRYYVNLVIQDIFESPIDYVLCRPGLDDNLIQRILEDSGFDSNDPYFSELVTQIKCTFTLEEISQFIGAFGYLDILKINIYCAIYVVQDPMKSRKKLTLVSYISDRVIYDFSEDDRYSGPLEIKGMFDPNLTWV